MRLQSSQAHAASPVGEAGDRLATMSFAEKDVISCRVAALLTAQRDLGMG